MASSGIEIGFCPRLQTLSRTFKSPTFIVGPVRCTQTRRYLGAAVRDEPSGRATATTAITPKSRTPETVSVTSRDARPFAAG
jgi:hypothetical protein